MKRLTEKDAYWLGEEFWTSAREPDDEEIEAVYIKLKHYEDLEEEGRLIVIELDNYKRDDQDRCTHRYCNKCDNYRQELQKYKELEKQGRLIELPCKVGDTLYWISDAPDGEMLYKPIEEVEVCDFNYNGASIQMFFADEGFKEFPVLPVVAIGKELFLTKEEAIEKWNTRKPMDRENKENE